MSGNSSSRDSSSPVSRRGLLGAAAALAATASLPASGLFIARRASAALGPAAGRSPAVGAVAEESAHGGAPATEGSSWRLRLSASSINFMRLSVEEAARRIARLGFEAIDLWSAHAGCPHLDDVLNRLGAEGLRKLLDETGLKLCGFSVYAGGYPRYAELLGRCGGGVAIRGSAPPCQPGELSGRMKQFFESLKGEIELAERHDSRLAIENHGHALLDSVDSIKAFVELNPSPRVGIALAPYHVQAAGESVEEAIRAAGKQLFYFYAWQHAPGTGQLPGVGPTDFGPWLAELARIGYAGYVNPFMHDEPPPDEMAELLLKSSAYLRRLAPRGAAAGG